MLPTDGSSPIDLNVGGVFYTASLDTLTSQPDSYLAAVFTGKVSAPQDSKGRFFLDRDGVLFRLDEL